MYSEASTRSEAQGLGGLILQDGLPKLGLVRFLCFAVQKHDLSSLFGQTLLQVSRLLETHILAAALIVAQDGTMLSVRPSSLTDANDDNELEMVLKSHIEKGKEMLEGCSVLGLPTDSGLVRGLSLTNTIVLTPKSLAVLACPQVYM